MNLDTVGTLAIGGAISPALIALATVPAQVRRHDRLIRERDEELALWVADDDVLLDRKLAEEIGELGKVPGLSPQHYPPALAQVKEGILQRYRDQERAAENRRAELRDDERWRHAVYRRLLRRPLPELETPQRAQPVLDEWRVDAEYQGHTAPVNDPTRRTLDGALSELPPESRPPALPP